MQTQSQKEAGPRKKSGDAAKTSHWAHTSHSEPTVAGLPPWLVLALLDQLALDRYESIIHSAGNATVLQNYLGCDPSHPTGYSG